MFFFFPLCSGILLLGFYITTMVKILLLYRWDLIADVLFEDFDCVETLLKVGYQCYKYSGLKLR